MAQKFNVSYRISYLILSILLLLFSSSLFSQDMSAEAVWTFDPILDVKHVATSDLDGDGILDVIAAEHSTTYYGDISRVYALDGEDGTTMWTYVLDDGARAMTVADLTNDGIIDVIVGASYHSTNTPDGRVHAIDGTDGSQLWTFYIGATIDAVTTGNFNGDAYLDVAAGSFDDYVYAINGETGVQLWRREIASLWINDVAAADVNGDNIDDVAYAHEYLAGYNNYLGVLDGTDGSDIWGLTVPYLVMTVKIEDIDTDGVLEAIFGVIYADNHGEIHVRTASDGTLEWDFNLGSVDHTNGEIVLGIGDIEDDGDNDLIVATYLGDHVVHAFNGDSNTPLWSSPPIDGNVRDIAFGDVSGEKDVDVILAASDRVEVISGVDGSDIWDYSVSGTMQGVAVYDMDNDEIMDVAAGGGANHSGSDPGIGVWALKTIISPVLWEYAFGEYGNALAVGDLDGDGFEDVVGVCSVADQAIAVDGETGTELWTWTGTQNLYSVTVGDFDGNTFKDVATGGADDMVSAINGVTGSTMWQFTDPTDQIYRKCLAAADLDHDEADEVIAGADDNNVYAIKTDTKSLLWTANVGGSVEDLKLADINGITPIDVVVAVGSGPSGNKVAAVDGADGSIIWEYATTNTPAHVAVGDVNDDDVLDVAAVIAPYATKGVEMIDGSTRLQIWFQPIDAASNVNTMDMEDLNGDKFPDVIVQGSSTDKKVHALDGTDGTELWAFLTGGEINTVMAYDVDLDGQMDVIAGSDDQTIYAINGLTGESFWSYACADDVMDVDVGDISGDGLPNMACITFGSDGIIYAFKSLATGPIYICGDANQDELVNLLDITFLIAFLYMEGPEPQILEACNVNSDGAVNLLDITYLIAFLYMQGPDPNCGQ